MKSILTVAMMALALGASAQSKLQQDREAIKSLQGFYRVDFNYAETFSPDKNYKYHDRHKSHAKEWAVIVEDSPKKIVLQHLLVVGDSMVIKHWREDWTYEDPTLLVYQKDNTWKKTTLPANEVKGKWTQKVFQVDDSPRYESTGTWTHVDGRHQWISTCDSPLPRREHTTRNDYNILNRRNFIYLTDKGWMFEQDNKKISRNADGDQLIAQEKGLEEFTKVDAAAFAYAQQWWKKQGAFWGDVRSTWDTVFADNTNIKLQSKVDGKSLFEKMFALGDQAEKEKWSAKQNQEAIKKLIDSYLAKG